MAKRLCTSRTRIASLDPSSHSCALSDGRAASAEIAIGDFERREKAVGRIFGSLGYFANVLGGDLREMHEALKHEELFDFEVSTSLGFQTDERTECRREVGVGKPNQDRVRRGFECGGLLAFNQKQSERTLHA